MRDAFTHSILPPGFHTEGEIYNFGVFGIETMPLCRKNPVLNFHEEVSLVTGKLISDNCHPVSVFGKAAEDSGNFKNLTGITILKGDRCFSEKILCTSSSTPCLN